MSYNVFIDAGRHKFTWQVLFMSYNVFIAAMM